MNKMKFGQCTIGLFDNLINMGAVRISQSQEIHVDMHRRSWLASTGVVVMGVMLAGCGHDDDVGFRGDVSRERMIVDDTGAGIERRLVVGQAIEIRLPIDVASGQTTTQKGNNSSRVRRDSGPERKVIDGRIYDVWVFVATAIGDATTTITLAYERSGQVLREMQYPINVRLS